MKYRNFGKTDLHVSEIGFGAWAIGGGAMIGNVSIGWGDTNDELSKQAIHAAIDKGINFFDTADIYGLGHSEKILGETIGKRKDLIIATKVGNVSRNNEFTIDYSKQYILSACDQSLKRLNREVIDFYQLHSARMPQLQTGECIEAMNELKQRGKIRYWGLSINTFDPLPEPEYMMENDLGNGFQLVLNLLNQKSLPLLNQANKKGYGVIVRMPLQFGLLTGKFNSSSTFPVNDHRKKRLTAEVIDKANEVLEPIWSLCTKYGVTKIQLALSYILNYPEVSTVIPGIRTPQHVLQNTKGFVQLEQEDLKMIENLGTTNFLPVMELIRQQG
jgi:aryl-alcohol dehydrogenase-like predicted oxidoreductase